jgi:hypothetical protein
MNQATNNLVQTEAASFFLLLAATETGRKAFLGAPEKFDGSVGPLNFSLFAPIFSPPPTRHASAKSASL